jgi:O-antigen/teichoic acid export membrane protein
VTGRGDREETMLKQSAAGSDSTERNKVSVRPVPVPAINRMAWSLKSALGRWPRIMNIGLLIAGLGLGQGSIFLLQTWLMAKGRLELLSLFATHYSLAMFGIIVVDGGSSAIIARNLVQVSSGHRERDDFWQIVSDTMALRLLVAVLVAIGAAIYALGLANDGFSRFYVLFGLPGLLLWAGNAVGLLDGLKLSGLSGITGSMAYAASAIGLAFAPDGSHEIAGSILGGAFSVGYLLTVAAQWAVLRSYGWAPRFRKVTVAGFSRALKDGAALLFQLVPGQMILRVQLVLSTIYLGAEATALFAYVKQLVTMATMIVAIILRVEFPRLVQILSGSREPRFRVVLDAQKMTLYCALALTAGGIAVSVFGLMNPQYRVSAASITLLAFCPTILTISLCLIMTQGLVALGTYGALAGAAAVSAVVGMAVSGLFVTIFGLYAFLFGELVFHLLNLVLMYRYMLPLKPRPSRAAVGQA